MATVLQQPKPAPAGKYDAIVEAHLARARGRIRTLDATVAFLVGLCGVLLYALAMPLLDRWLELSPLVRQIAFLSAGLVLLAYCATVLVRLLLPINPYYAARHLELVIPDAKNSVVNWLDLREQPLPPAIRGAVGQRAARDLAQADLEQAISGRRAGWLGIATVCLVLALFITLIVFGGLPFFSLVRRAFVPFIEGAIATRTQLTLLQPAGGDVVVAVGKPVHFAVEVNGRVPQEGQPDALKLLFHYQPEDPYEERPLEREQGSEWTTNLPGFQVQNGFWYKITGGDAETPEHQVQVRTPPLVSDWDITYHYRPYLGWPDDHSRDPTIRAIRGTEVTLVAHTNRRVKALDSRLELEVPGPKKVLAAEAVPDDPQALRFSFVLREDGKYRLWFTSKEGESTLEPRAYPIQVLKDEPPKVELKKPGKDVRLPANGVLPLEGVATDDHGLQSLTLNLRVIDGPVLPNKPYREGKSFLLTEGGYPRKLDYRDFIDLAALHGKPVELKTGMVLEYWVEASDACDFPGPNVARSQAFKVTIAPPDADAKKQEQERNQAREEQKQHEAQQDQKLEEESKAPKTDRPQESAPKPGEPKSNEPKKDDTPKEQQSQPQEKPAESPQKDDPRQQEAEKLYNELQKQQQQQKGAAKDPGQQSKGDKKGEGQHDSKPNAGQSKGGGDGPSKPEAGQGKGAGSKEGQPKPDSGESKGQGQEGVNQEKAGSKGAAGSGAGAGQKKGGGQPEGEAAKGQEKGAGQGESRSSAGQTKEGGDPQGKGRADAGQAKSAGQEGATADKQSAGSAKDDSQRVAQGASKEGNGPEKSGDSKSGGGAENRGENKPASEEKAGGSGVAKAESKDDGIKSGTGSGAGEKTQENVESLANKLHSADARERADAARKLEQLSRESPDPKERTEARESLEEAVREQASASKEGTAKQQPKSPTGECGTCKGGPGAKQAGECGACKGGDANGQKGGAGQGKGGGNKSGGNPGNGSSSGGSGNGNEGDVPNGLAKGRGHGSNPTQQGGGGDGGQPHGIADQLNQGQGEPPLAEKGTGAGNSQAPGDLVLEDLKKLLEDLKNNPQAIDKALDRAGMTRKQLQDVEDYVKEKLPPPQQGGPLQSIGAKRATGGDSKAGDARSGTQAQPPPGFRDSTREFTRKLAEEK